MILYLVKPQNLTPVAEAELVNRQQRFKLAGILRITELMLSAAEHGDWQDLENLERERKLELSEFSVSREFFEASDNVAEAYASLLFLNDKIMALVEAEKHRLGQKFYGNRQSNKAAMYYRDF